MTVKQILSPSGLKKEQLACVALGSFPIGS